MIKHTSVIATLILGCLFVNAQTIDPKLDSAITTPIDTSGEAILPYYSVNTDVLEGEQQTQNVAGVLQASKDIYVNTAGFNFSAARFRLRGLASRNFTVMMNGVSLNDPETGGAFWSGWGGLNDITRYQEFSLYMAPSAYSFGGIGGTSNITIQASKLRKGTKISYALSNRSYRHRAMITHSTGMMANGWAVSISASGRYAKEEYVEGTFYRGASYFISLEKKINEKHSIGFTSFDAATVRGRKGIAVQEAYDLTKNNFYNPYWGVQTNAITGKQVKRNSRVRNNNKPMFFLTHYFKVNKKTTINSSLYYSTGRSGSTAINWYQARNPRPDYYKNRPSYFIGHNNTALFGQFTAAWKNDINTRQVNWDQFYFANSKNLYTQQNANGIIGNTVTGNRSKYVVQEYRQDPTLFGFNSNIDHQFSEKIHFNGAINVKSYKSENYTQLNDLLGGDFWVDINQFAQQDFEHKNIEQNNVNNPNNIVHEGERFGYDYNMNVNSADAFGQVTAKLGKIEAFGALSIGNTSFWRTGKMVNGVFPNNSFGDSKKNNFLTGGIKGGITYKITGRHIISANGAFLSAAPSTRNAYVSARTRDFTVNGLRSEQTLSGDVNYIIRYPKLKIRATYYYAQIDHQTWARTYYHDELRTFVNYNMTGVNQQNNGVELGVEGNIGAVTLSAVYSKSNTIYTSNPNATITANNTTETLAENRTAYLSGMKVGGMPQDVGSLGIKYNSSKHWFAGVNINYFGQIYIAPNPDRRSKAAVAGFVNTDPQPLAITGQQKLDNNYTINMFVNKSIKIKEYFISLSLNVTNVLNEKNFQTGGFEQLRYNAKNINKFPTKIAYMRGRTYFAMISFRF